MADDALDAQAQAMAEKALAALPPAAREAKIAKVKEGILKRLRAQAGPASAGAAAAAPAPTLSGLLSGGACAPPAQPPPASGAPPPPTHPPTHPPAHPAAARVAPIAKLAGVEMCGDEPWFADPVARLALQEKVMAAHAEQKILVGVPADEIRRICPGGGRILGAGAVLRLGGCHLGGYGENDIAYAYRQLSRALHPDKNPGVQQAAAAFQRLSEAANELREALTEARSVLKQLRESTGCAVTDAMSERPQEALFAEASRILSGVLGVAGEGTVPLPSLHRAMIVFNNSAMFNGCQAQVLITLWFESPYLLEAFAGVQLRTAYDCAQKHLRAQFLCALNRVAMVEARA